MWSTSHFEQVSTASLPTVRKPLCAQYSTPQESGIVLILNGSHIFLGYEKVSIYFGMYVHDRKAFDTSINSFSTVWKMLLLLAMLIFLPYQNICLQCITMKPAAA